MHEILRQDAYYNGYITGYSVIQATVAEQAGMDEWLEAYERGIREGMEAAKADVNEHGV